MSKDIHKEPFYKKATADEQNLWLKETSNVKKLSPTNLAITPKKKKKAKLFFLDENKIACREIEYSSIDDSCQKTKNSHNKKSKKKTKNLPIINYIIDLHGLSQAQSYEAVTKELQYAYDNNMTFILIITGKGKSLKENDHELTGILRKNVPKWLESQPLKKIIFKVGVAKNEHGGNGALYVQLKKKHK